MVSFKPQGRLGNFLFCVATTIAYAKKHGLEYSMPSLTNDQVWNPVYLQHLVNPKWQPGKVDVLLPEQTLYKYDELPFKEEWRDKQIVLKGYFQNSQYFEQYRDKIIDIIIPKRTEWYLDSISVHVRRGDYLILKEKHPEVTEEWYLNAMRFFKEEGKAFRYIFFSDDIEWCKKTFGYRPNCFFVESGTEWSDLLAMSSCTHHINSASTFSWMGAWLNQNSNKKVVVPKQWLMPSHSNQWTEEIVPKQWIRI